MKEFDLKKTKIFLIIMTGVLLLIGASFALYNIVLEGKREHVITTGKVSFSYKEPLDSLSLLADRPMTDEEGKAQSNYYEFQVKASSDMTETINYVIYLQEQAVTYSLGTNNIKLYLTEVNNNVETEVVAPTLISDLLAIPDITNSKAIYGSSFILNNSNETKTYRLRLWLKQDFNLNSLIQTSTNAQGEKNIKLNDYKYEFKVNVKTGKMPVKPTILSMYKSDDLHIGDFVTYDAGSWIAEEIASIQVGPNSSLVSANNSTAAPSTAYQFGGFVAGQSRNVGVAVNTNWGEDYTYAKMYNGNDSSNKVPLSGWRIFDIDNNYVTLISAANPEDYYHPSDACASEYILTGQVNEEYCDSSEYNSDNYTARDWSMYENSAYNASNARVITKTELDNWYNKYMGVTNADTETDSTFQRIYSSPYLSYQNLIDNHSFYWLGSAFGSRDLYYVDPNYRDVYNNFGNALGVRVLVSIPLTSKVDEIPAGIRTVTVNGMSYNGGTYGSETTQTYNVWRLKENLD